MSTAWMDEAEFRKTVGSEAVALAPAYTLNYDGRVRFTAVYADASRSAVKVVATMVFSWKDATKPSQIKVHNFVINFDPHTGEWAYWCGDQWLEGKSGDQRERRDRAIEYLTTKGLRTGPGGVVLHDGTGFPPSTSCGFFQRGNKCKHGNGAFHKIVNDLGLDQFINDVKSQAAPLGGAVAPAAPAAPVSGVDPMLRKMRRYAFTRNLVLEGDKGWGKTWLVTQYAADPTHDVQKVVYIGGHEGLESVDLIGHMIKTADGSLAWKDGKLAEAFRTASAGIKTLVLFDEVLRVRKRELSVLVGALAPHADGKLHLSTGRPVNIEDGIAEEEVISCEREDLWVVATTNVGAGYEVDDMEEALSDRFPIVLRIDGSTDMLKSKLGPGIKAKGFSGALLDRLVKLYEGFQIGRTNSELTRQINLRHLAEVVDTASVEGEVAELLRDRVPQWVDRDVDGRLLPMQVSFVEKLITASFGGRS